ncbi:MAG: DUF2461 domain-containing protein [Dehalococcoidia bacterium]|nr:DUF2461 domain-containing protein [Dehalococcoidia bacterium]
MTTSPAFSEEARDFLRELPTHDKAWFDASRPAYQALIAEPAKALVEAVTAELQHELSPGIVGVPRVNGSISPINRDIRFSADKTPYKDHLLFRWWEGEEKKSAPTLFVRLAADEVGFATGIMLPSLDRWRELVDAEATGAPLASSIAALVAETGAEVAGVEYKRVPKPYAADHPREGLLRCKWLQVRWMEPFPADESHFAPWCARQLLRCGDVHRWLVANL